MPVTNVTRGQQLQFGLGITKQTASNVINSSANIYRWRKLNASIPYQVYHTENDATEIGKGTEFAQNVYLTSTEPAAQTIDKYGSVEFTLWGWSFALGPTLATPISAGNIGYSIIPLDPAYNLEPNYFTLASIIQSGSPTTYSVGLGQVGCAVEQVTSEFKFGPGRASFKTNVEYAGLGVQYNNGSGQYTTALPPTLQENYMLGASLAITLVSGATTINYISNKSILSGTMTWKQNLNMPMRYLPGSGFDANNFQIGDRFLIGERVPGLMFTVFLDENSLEYAALIAQSTWAVTISLYYPAAGAFIPGTSGYGVRWSYATANFEMVETVTESGFVAVTCRMMPLFSGAETGSGGSPPNGLSGFITVAGNTPLFTSPYLGQTD
jgi:hypothetical protein